MIETAGEPLKAQEPAAHKVRSVRAVGTRAVLAELSGTQDVLALQALLLEKPLPGQQDVLAAAETVLVKADSPASARRIAARLMQLDLTAPVQRDGELVVIDTVYDGEDLAEVGRLTGLGTDGVIAAHSGQIWTVAFAGFAPGFGYMIGENQQLEVPRRSSPRTAVPAGSVALAGNYSAVYPRRSPGGWQLIGRTNAKMWDLDREPPALAAPGHRVQFRPVRDALALAAEPVAEPAIEPAAAPAAEGTAPEPAAGQDVTAGIRIVSPGLQSLIQDLGRDGNSPADTYLNIPKLLAVAAQSGADAMLSSDGAPATARTWSPTAWTLSPPATVSMPAAPGALPTRRLARRSEARSSAPAAETPSPEWPSRPRSWIRL